MLCSLFNIFHTKGHPINTKRFSLPVGDPYKKAIKLWLAEYVNVHMIVTMNGM